MTALIARTLPRRAILQALMAVPALSLFRALPPAPALPTDDEIVEVNGWFLKRSEVA